MKCVHLLMGFIFLVSFPARSELLTKKSPEGLKGNVQLPCYYFWNPLPGDSVCASNKHGVPLPVYGPNDHGCASAIFGMLYAKEEDFPITFFQGTVNHLKVKEPGCYAVSPGDFFKGSTTTVSAAGCPLQSMYACPSSSQKK